MVLSTINFHLLLRATAISSGSLLLKRHFGKISADYAAVLKSKDKYLNMMKEERRKNYKNGFVEIDSVTSWTEYYNGNSERLKEQLTSDYESGYPIDKLGVNTDLSKKVSLWQGDITKLEIDAIVNAADKTLLGGGGVDGAIHRGAGPDLLKECKLLHGCDTGDAKMTGGYLLPAKHIVHTVGPVGEKPGLLESCYKKSLELALSKDLRTIAFPCISTGVYGYPQEKAALVALRTVRNVLQSNSSAIDRVIFCLFLPTDVRIYENLMQLFFPVE